MRWKKAHRNARRVAKTVRIPHAYFMRYLDITEQAWEEWLRKLLPAMLNENSVAARILMRKPEPMPTWRAQLIPRRHFDAMKGKAESKRESAIDFAHVRAAAMHDEQRRRMYPGWTGDAGEISRFGRS